MQSRSGDALNHLKYVPPQAFQSITSALWYVLNSTIQNDFKIETVNQLATKQYKKIHSKLQSHFNPLIAEHASNSILIIPHVV